MQLRNPRGYYAAKVLTSHSRENFEMELSSLLFSEDNDCGRKHLTQVLATFEERNTDGDKSTFWLLFDCAEGDLQHFWNENSLLVCDLSHCLWMAEQFHGLAEALQAIHNDRLETVRYIPSGVDDKENLYGRHGDIKPGNMLWFSSLHSRRLTLADFGLGRLHTRISRSKQNPAFIERTATYRSPEFDIDGGLISPKSDVCSLGYVYLEYITWFLLGLDGVTKFAEERLEKDKYNFMADTFFRIEADQDGQQTAVIKPSVKRWIQKLKDHSSCTWYLLQMLELIEEHMIHPEREKRIRAMPLVKSLDSLRKTCRQSPTFYNQPLKHCELPPGGHNWKSHLGEQSV
jgi:serine/threonine protein kinase